MLADEVQRDARARTYRDIRDTTQAAAARLIRPYRLGRQLASYQTALCHAARCGPRSKHGRTSKAEESLFSAATNVVSRIFKHATTEAWANDLNADRINFELRL